MNKKQKTMIFKALSHDTRFDIFENIFKGGYACPIYKNKKDKNMLAQATCVNTIAKTFDSKLPTISRHLKILKDSKVINITKKGSNRYIEPNIEVAKELVEYFTNIVEKFESGYKYQFDTTE